MGVNMSSITEMFTSAVNTIQTNYATASTATIVAGSFLALVTTEMAVRAIYDGYKMLTPEPGATDDQRERVWKSFGANLGGTLFYGMLASNLLPGGPLIGAAIFTVYSAIKYEEQDTYLITKIIGKISYAVCEAVGKIAVQVWNVVSGILQALCECLFNVTRGFFECVYNIVSAIPLPKHPIWIGVAIVAIAIIATR